jgi:hypothetical protein
MASAAGGAGEGIGRIFHRQSVLLGRGSSGCLPRLLLSPSLLLLRTSSSSSINTSSINTSSSSIVLVIAI